jgi:hypothetical protein
MILGIENMLDTGHDRDGGDDVQPSAQRDIRRVNRTGR